AITTTPNRTTVTQGATAVTLTDTADLEGGDHPTDSIIFTLFHDGGGAPVFTQTVKVSGNGTYTTPPGFTLPTRGTATGTYQRDASYSVAGNNNAASDTNNANEQVSVMQVADLALSKQVSPTQQMEGFDVTYTFILHNNGPSPATNATVTDPFPGVTVVGPNTPSQGTFDPSTGVWSVGTLAPGASAILTVTARVDVLGPITSTAQVSADQSAPDPPNHTGDPSLIGLPNNSSGADKSHFARIKRGAAPAAPAPPPPGGQARGEEASDGWPEVEALDDFFTLAGE